MIERSPFDALAGELGAEAARIERDLRRELAVGMAEIRQELEAVQRRAAEMELRAVNAECSLADSVRDRLATVRNGDSVTAEEVRPLISAEIAAQLAQAEPPPDLAGMIAAAAENEMDRCAEAIAARAATLVPVLEVPALPDIPALVGDAVAAAFVSQPVPAQFSKADAMAAAEEVLTARIAELLAGISAETVSEIAEAKAKAAIAAMPVAVDGHTPTEAEIEPIVEMVVQRVVSGLPAAITIDDVRPAIENEIAMIFDGMPKPRDGDPGPRGEPGLNADPITTDKIVEALMAAPDAIDAAMRRYLADNPPPQGDPGPPGEPGPEGPPGKMPIARAWADEVHYEGVVVSHEGSTYQALRDTGRGPTHQDWICLAAAGKHGTSARSFAIRGTYSPEIVDYRALDVVALNGGSFAARLDNPGPCPGDGWQLLAHQGKQGKPGDRGIPGPRGDRGPPGPAVKSLAPDENGLLVLTNGDGSIVTGDLYPLLDRVQRA